MRTFISLIIVIALALFSFWFQALFKETPIVKVRKDEHFPDYFMENFSVTSLNTQGEPAYILTATRMEHFADDDSAELQQPVLELRSEKNNWRISARRASILADKTIIHLYDDVRVSRMSLDDRGPLQIDTEYLKIHTDDKIAETDRLAHLKTRELELDTRGMIFDSNQGIVKLKSEVKGRYAPVK